MHVPSYVILPKYTRLGNLIIIFFYSCYHREGQVECGYKRHFRRTKMHSIALRHEGNMALPRLSEGADNARRRETKTERRNFTFKPSVIRLLELFSEKQNSSENDAVEAAIKSAVSLIPILREIPATVQAKRAIDRDDVPGWVNVDALFETEADDYLWKVRGASMTGGNVREGDFILIRPQSTCDSGEVAVVMLDLPTGRRPALRRVRFASNSSSVQLVSLDNEKDVVTVEGRDLEICGVKRGVIQAN